MKIELGMAITFKPHILDVRMMGDTTLTGRVVYINRKNRWFLVEVRHEDGTIYREGFKF